MVCVVSVSTGRTKEGTLVRTIGFINTTAHGACSTGIPRVDGDHRNTSKRGFVADKRTQLSERPGGLCSALRFSSLDPRAYAGQFFDGDSSLRALGLCYKFRGNAVVCVASEPGFFSLPVREESLCRLRAFALQAGTKPAVSTAESVYHSPGEDFAVGVHGNTDNAHVYTENAVKVPRFGSFDIAGGKQVENAVHEGEVGLSLSGLKKLFCSFAAGKRYLHATGDRPDRNNLPVGVPAKNAVIKSYSAVSFEGTLAFLVKFVSRGHLFGAQHSDLGGKPEVRPGREIGQLLKPELPERTSIPCLLGDVVTGAVSCFKGFFQSSILFLRRQEFYLSGHLHAEYILPRRSNPCQI